MTILAFSICDLGWPHIILSWLLPFLCGLLLGWAIWARFKKQVENLEGDIIDLKKQISGLEEELDACRHARTDLNGELSSVKGQLREKNLQISTLESSLAAAAKESSSKSKGPGKSSNTDAESGKKGGKDKEVAKKSSDDKESKASHGKSDAAKDGDISSSMSGDSGVAGTIAKGALAGTIASSLGADDDAATKPGSDDLKKIEGVGPKIAGLLNEGGINSYAELADSDDSTLQKILDDAGPRYKIANPTTWAQQAALARDGKWDELKKLQDTIEGGVIVSGAKGSKKDDLKKVEGIGPKIESLLNADGLHSFAELASASIDQIQKILDDAGPRYRIANPSTWAQQAALARDEKWDELKVLQDSLKGGRK